MKDLVSPLRNLTIILFALVLLYYCFIETKRYSCEFPDNSRTLFSFSEMAGSITLGGIRFSGRESWTRDIQITDETVSLYYVQGLATRTDDGEYVGFKDLYHYQFNRQDKTLTLETSLDSIQKGPTDWTHPAKLNTGQCETMTHLSYWEIFITALLQE